MTYKGEQIGIPTLETIQEVIDTFAYKGYRLSPTKILKAIEKNKEHNHDKDLRNVIAGYNSYPSKYSLYPNELFGDFNDLVEYKELLQYDEWKDFKEKVLSVRGCKCEWEGCTAIDNLHIHHDKYVKPGKNNKRRLPWQYPIEEMRVYCEAHHNEAHGVKYYNKV